MRWNCRLTTEAEEKEKDEESMTVDDETADDGLEGDNIKVLQTTPDGGCGNSTATMDNWDYLPATTVVMNL